MNLLAYTHPVWFDCSINKEEITSVDLHDIEQNFAKTLDVDHDGILDMKELIKWVEPDGFQGVGYTVLFNLMGDINHLQMSFNNIDILLPWSVT